MQDKKYSRHSTFYFASPQINIFMYESDAKDAKSLYVTCLDEDPKKNDLIGDCVINLAKVLEQGEHDGRVFCSSEETQEVAM